MTTAISSRFRFIILHLLNSNFYPTTPSLLTYMYREISFSFSISLLYLLSNLQFQLAALAFLLTSIILKHVSFSFAHPLVSNGSNILRLTDLSILPSCERENESIQSRSIAHAQCCNLKFDGNSQFEQLCRCDAN
jgi:hypothetical protein